MTSFENPSSSLSILETIFYLTHFPLCQLKNCFRFYFPTFSFLSLIHRPFFSFLLSSLFHHCRYNVNSVFPSFLLAPSTLILFNSRSVYNIICLNIVWLKTAQKQKQKHFTRKIQLANFFSLFTLIFQLFKDQPRINTKNLRLFGIIFKLCADSKWDWKFALDNRFRKWNWVKDKKKTLKHKSISVFFFGLNSGKKNYCSTCEHFQEI